MNILKTHLEMLDIEELSYELVIGEDNLRYIMKTKERACQGRQAYDNKYGVDEESLFRHCLSYSGFEMLDLTDAVIIAVRKRIHQLTEGRNEHDVENGLFQDHTILDKVMDEADCREAKDFLKDHWEEVRVDEYMGCVFTDYFFSLYWGRELEYETEVSWKVYKTYMYLRQIKGT